MFWFLIKHICISKYINELIFVIFLNDLWDFIKGKKITFKSLKILLLAFCRSTTRSTEPEVGRPTCTKRARPGPVDRTVDRQRVSALWKWPGRPAGRPLGHCPEGGRPASRPTFPMVRNLTVHGRPGGRPTAVQTAELASNGHIFEAYKRGFSWTVFYKIWSRFSS